jgi:hypothetical protein
MNQQQIVKPTTGYLVNIVDDKLQEGGFGVKVNINYLTDYKVLILEIGRWHENELMDFSIKRSLYMEYWADALAVADHIKRIAFDDYKITDESQLTDLIDRIIHAQTQN